MTLFTRLTQQQLRSATYPRHDSLNICITAMCTVMNWDKMAEILVDDNFGCIFLNENDRIPILISLKFVPRSPIDNNLAMVQVMAWHPIGDKPLSEPMVIRFTDIYMRH